MINSTTITTTTTTTTISLIMNTPKYYNKFRHIQNILIQCTLPYIFAVACVGLITNTATIVLLSQSFLTKNTRHKWTLIALAISDLVHNSALSIRVIHDITKEKIEHLCIIISFLSQLAELLSACYTVLFTVQRYQAVRYPLKAVVRNPSSPLVTIFLIFLLSLIFCFLLSYSNTYVDCHEELQLSWFIADALFSFIIPFSFILLFNIRIVRLIQQHAQSSITKQSIIIRPRKRLRNNKNNKECRQEESQSIVYLAGNSSTLRGTLIEIEMDNVPNSNCLTNQKENNTPKLLHENQILNKTISSDRCAPNSYRHSIRSQSSLKKKLFSRKESQLSNDTDSRLRRASSYKLQSNRVTRMLILVSTCFLILNAPAHLCLIAMKIYTEINYPVFNEHVELEYFQKTTNLTNNQLKKFVFIQTTNETIIKNQKSIIDDIDIVDDSIIIHLFYIAIQITQWISYASYSINFFLYSYSGMTFRSSLRQFFNKLRKH